VALNRTQILANLEATILNYSNLLLSVSIDPPHLTYTVGDQTFSWTEYQTFLQDTITRLNKAYQVIGGPYQIATRMKG
jgi:hypothetical protein